VGKDGVKVEILQKKMILLKWKIGGGKRKRGIYFKGETQNVQKRKVIGKSQGNSLG